MIYSVQHNGKGKQHLIPEDGDGELCGTSGVLLFTCSETLEYKGGKWFEKFRDSEIEINESVLSSYCKKCIKKAIKDKNLVLN